MTELQPTEMITAREVVEVTSNPWVETGYVDCAFVTPKQVEQRLNEGYKVVPKDDPLWKRAFRAARKVDRRRRGGPRRTPHGQHRILVAKIVATSVAERYLYALWRKGFAGDATG